MQIQDAKPDRAAALREAGDPTTASDRLAELAQHQLESDRSDGPLLAAIAGNPNADQDTLETLAALRDDAVHRALAGNEALLLYAATGEPLPIGVGFALGTFAPLTDAEAMREQIDLYGRHDAYLLALRVALVRHAETDSGDALSETVRGQLDAHFEALGLSPCP